ncbi:MAG: GTP-binding protein, partial [bacterium]|nr:GTP-binding protein [bacterium]
MSRNRIRNFCIIAHIDHGKSTLADRFLESTGTLTKKAMRAQVLDTMDLERERGITIKSHPIRMDFESKSGESYRFNLIDTPGHVDFTYEVSRSLAACEGAVLVVDAVQGVQAQTLSNLHLAVESGLEVIPVINKIDLPNARIDDVKTELLELLGGEPEEILCVSARNGDGVEELM